eukprot:8061639-Ditylum_brightwellii.AAC.1
MLEASSDGFCCDCHCHDGWDGNAITKKILTSIGLMGSGMSSPVMGHGSHGSVSRLTQSDSLGPGSVGVESR